MNKSKWSFPLILAAALTAQADKIDYPAAKRIEQTDHHHGVAVTDPYRWLEDAQSLDTLSWVAAQATLFTAQIDPQRRDTIEQRIARLTRFDTYSNLQRAGEHYFFSQRAATQATGAVLVQQGLAGEPRVILDPDEMTRSGQRIAGLAPSRDGRWLAYQLAEGNSDWRTLRVRAVRSGSDSADELSDLHRISSGVSWKLDGSGFYYLRMSRPEADTDRGTLSVHFHQLGTPQSSDIPIFARSEHPEWILAQQLSWDGRYLIVTASDAGATENRVFVRDERDPSAGFRELFGNRSASYTFLDHRQGRMWFHTSLSAPRGRVIAVDLVDADSIHEIVPQTEDTIAGGSMVGGNAVAVRGDHLLITYVSDASPRVHIHDLEGRQTGHVALPDIGAIWGGFSGNPRDREVFYSFLSLSDPNTVFRLDVTTGESRVFKRPELPFDPADFVTRQVFYTSKDGTRVPMFISHHRDLKPSGTAPAFMYGYGAWGWIAFPWYQPHVVAMLEKGWVYALPGIRGGGEYGEAWHQAGIGRNKQNAIDDYIAAARWLSDNRYTSADRLVANGGSASGALAAAAVMQRPDLFGAAVIDIPTLDMLRYDRLTPTRHAWSGEMGSIDDADDFKALLAYSPYHNVSRGACYPAILTMPGEGDELAPPAHSYKFTAAMQNAQACSAPIAMKVIPNAGHSHGRTGAEIARTWADALSFLERVMPAAGAIESKGANR